MHNIDEIQVKSDFILEDNNVCTPSLSTSFIQVKRACKLFPLELTCTCSTLKQYECNSHRNKIK